MRIKLSTLSFVAAGIAVAVNPWMVIPWMALGAVTKVMENSSSPEALMKVGCDALGRQIVAMGSIEGTKFIMQQDASGLQPAWEKFQMLRSAYPV